MTNKMKKRILVVDDDIMFKELMSDILQEAGYFVETAENGKDALQKLSNNCYNLIISETYLNVMDGMELYQNITEIAPWFKKRFLFITDRITFETICFLSENDLRYMIKPVRVLHLLCLLDDILMERLSDTSTKDAVTKPEDLKRSLIET